MTDNWSSTGVDSEATSKPPIPGWLFALVASGGLLCVASGIVAMFMLPKLADDMKLAPTRIERGDELSDAKREFLVESGYVEEDEQILFYYSIGMTMHEDGNLLTDRRVISYGEDWDGEIVSSSRDLVDIAFVEVDYAESDFEDTVAYVYGADDDDDDSIELWLSPEEGLDREFLDELVARARAFDGSVFVELTEYVEEDELEEEEPK